MCVFFSGWKTEKKWLSQLEKQNTESHLYVL